MNIPLISAVTGVFKDIVGVVDQLVEDKDKKNELIHKVLEMQNNLNIQLLQLKTTPWVDATVKILFAFRDIIIPLFRPVVSSAMAAWVAYASVKGYPMNPAVEAVMAAAFPGWVYSRHKEKNRKH